jgi:uncharacterized delta-60 repeat protein
MYKVQSLLYIALVCSFLVPLFPGTGAAVEIKWIKSFTGGIDTEDRGYAVAMASDGNIVASGSLQLDGGGRVGWLRKYSPTGKRIWGKRIKVGRQKLFNSATGVAVTGDGSVYVCGTYKVKASGIYNIWLARYTAEGNLVWCRKWGAKAGIDDRANAVAAGPGNKIYVTGKTVGAGLNNDLVVLKYDSAGKRLWVRRFDGSAGYDDGGSGVAVASDGSIYVSGSTQYDTESYETDIWLLKLLPARGKLEWVKQVHGAGNGPSSGTGVAVTSRGQVYICGSIDTTTEGINGWLAKYKSGGTKVWEVEFDASPTYGDAFLGVSVTRRNAPVVTGFGGSSSQDYYLAAVKYTRKGDWVWSARHMGSDQDMSFGRGVAVAPSGAAYVVGDVDPVAGNDDVILIKLK